jgi:Tfp pilus assembly protein PilO
LISFFIFPKYQKFNSFKKEILAKEKELSSQEKYFETLKETSEELKKYETSLSKIDSALPQNPSLPELLNFIQKASSQSGLSLKEISPAVTSPLEKSEIKETRINFLLVGSYQDFKNFLFILEKSARLIDVENISFASPKEKEGLFNFAITIKVYSY